MNKPFFYSIEGIHLQLNHWLSLTSKMVEAGTRLPAIHADTVLTREETEKYEIYCQCLVEMDTQLLSIATQVLNILSADPHRHKEYAKYKSPMDFEKNYSVDDSTWNKLNNYVVKDSVSFKSLGTKEKSELSKQIKILTARQIWRNEGLFEVSNAQDELVKKALEVLKN